MNPRNVVLFSVDVEAAASLLNGKDNGDEWTLDNPGSGIVEMDVVSDDMVGVVIRLPPPPSPPGFNQPKRTLPPIDEDLLVITGLFDRE
ncbi:hypothetical protein ONZ45_g11613 [Pleurotus djamor]|nr:hypothetical protein ONZ45_g11613 [Pleurotus djamor]